MQKYIIREQEYNEVCPFCNKNQNDSFMRIYNNDWVSNSPFLKCIDFEYIFICYNCITKLSKDFFTNEEFRHIQDELREESDCVNKRIRKVSTSLSNKVYKKFGFKCLKCGNTEDLHIDHVIPYSRGGETKIDNLQVLCRTCNISKGTKTIDYRNEK